jgi:exodeoxyribonuclease VII large subunit
MFRYLEDLRTQVKFSVERMGSPQERLVLAQEKLSGLTMRLGSSTDVLIQKNRSKWGELSALMNGLSPLKVLERGYSIVKKGPRIVKKASQVQTGDEIKITLSDGELTSRIL